MKLRQTWIRGLLLLAVLAGIAAGPAQGEGGSPILIVESYSTSPTPVNSGQSFTLTVTVKNIGTKYAEQIVASVNGGSQFVQVGPGAQVGQLDPGFSATFSLPVQAASLSTGAYDLNLMFSYRIGNSGEFGQPRSVGVQVQGIGTTVTGDPQVVVESALPLSQPADVGSTFDVQVVLRNAGPRLAYGVSLTLGQNEYVSPAVGSGSTQVGDLEPGETVTLTLGLVLDQASATGRVAQTFEMAFRDSDDVEHSSTESASLDLGALENEKPQLIVSAHSTLPELPAPGDTFSLRLTVTNVGKGAAESVLARLGGEDGLGPFLPLGTSNVGFAAEIPPGGSATFTQTLLMDGEVQAGAYALAVDLSYDDGGGETHLESETIGLLTLSRPQVQIDLTKTLPNPAAVGQEFDIALEIINVGRQRLEVTTVEISSTSLGLTKNALYVGPLDPSISGGLTANAMAREAGTASFQVIIHYRDELNRMQSLAYDYQVSVEAASAFTPLSADTPPAQAGGFWQAVRRLLGLGG
jgi:hypothetical protein